MNSGIDMCDMCNAKIRSTFLGIEDHGILTAYLYLEYSSGCQGFGGWAFDEYDEGKRKRIGVSFGMEFIRLVLETLKVDSWEKLPGTPIRARAERTKVHAVGHYIEDRWFTPDTDLKHLAE